MSAAALPLLAFQHHVGNMFLDPADIEFVCSIGVGDLAVVERGRLRTSDGARAGSGTKEEGYCNVVVKGYKPFVVGSPSDFRELLLEASKLHRLHHPNITRFLGLGCFSHGSLAEVRSSMFMVEEYVGSRTLRKLIGEQMRCRLKNLYDMRTALRWAVQVAQALAALHEQQPPYIHGDVKADNVFLTDAADLRRAQAKIGDLKPHRHVYDREPSTLSQHQQHITAAQASRQSSLEKYTLERSSGSSNSSNSSVLNSTASCSSSAMQQCWLSSDGGKQSQQQQQQVKQEKPLQQTGSLPVTGSNSSAVLGNACCKGSDTPGRQQSSPVPIVARGSRLEGVGSCPGLWGPAAAAAVSSMGAAGCASSSPDNSSSDRRAAGTRSLPITACLSAAEIAEEQAAMANAAATHAVGVGDGDDDAAENAADADAAREEGYRRRSGRTICLSDSASSTNSSGGSGCSRLRSAVELMSLAAADDDDDGGNACTQGVRLGRSASGLAKQAATAEVAAVGSLHDDLQLGGDCSSSGICSDSWDCSAHNGGYERRCRSLPNDELQQACTLSQQLQQEQEQAGSRLYTSKSAPSDICDAKVHHGHLMMPLTGLLYEHEQQQQPSCKPQQVQPFKQQQQQHLERKLSAGAAVEKHQQQSVMQYGWELSPSGAASPCGAVHSVMLDLFADLAEEDEVVLNRRFRDGPWQYTLSPGSFVQQRLTPSSSLPAAASAAAGTGLLKSSLTWDSAFSGSSSSGLSGSGSSGCTAGSPMACGGQQLERTGSLKAGAPSAIESKQHGSNSAFAALTAIDCIREETSSIATDSVMGSCPPSRDSTAHGGVHYYNDDVAPSPVSVKDQEDSSSRSLPKLGLIAGLSPKPRGLLLSSLLPMRSIASSGGSNNSGSSDDDGGDDGDIYPTTTATAAAAALSDDGNDSGAPVCGQSAFAAGVLLSSTGSGSSDGDDQAAAEPAATAVPSPGPKRVRFTVERAAGATPSRDYSLLYAAPELLSGQRPTEKVDVFAFGVVLYELLSRSLLVSHCAAAVGQNRSRRSKHGSRHGSSKAASDHSPSAAAHQYAINTHVLIRSGSGGSECSDGAAALPEQQLLLAYAQMVAGGYRPPMPGHFPQAVQDLISSCWAAEPHERPRMSDVLDKLHAWWADKQLIACLDSYLAGLADIGYGPGGAAGPSCGCSCVIS